MNIVEFTLPIHPQLVEDSIQKEENTLIIEESFTDKLYPICKWNKLRKIRMDFSSTIKLFLTSCKEGRFNPYRCIYKEWRLNNFSLTKLPSNKEELNQSRSPVRCQLINNYRECSLNQYIHKQLIY